MRAIYISVIAVFTTCLLLFMFCFAYLDRTNHKIYHYVINKSGRDIGTLKIDKFRTEEKTLYKSIQDIQLDASPSLSKSIITYDNKLGMESYEVETVSNRVTDTYLINIKNHNASYVSCRGAGFQTLSGIPLGNDTFIFKQDSLITYLPLIESYDMRSASPQWFDILNIFSNDLPPVRKFISIDFLKDEYVKISSGLQGPKKRMVKVRTRSLALNIRNFPQVLVWLARSDKSIIKVEIPRLGFKMTRVFYPKVIEGGPFVPKDYGYVSRTANFRSKAVSLEGTLTVPEGQTRRPAVLLVGGSYRDDRNCRGLFSTISDFLSKNGYCVLRFDRRGVGKSGGVMVSSALSDTMEDISSALAYLAGQKEVDAGRIAVIGQQEGAYYAMKAAVENKALRSLILMSPLICGRTEAYKQEEVISQAARRFKLNDQYIRMAVKSRDESLRIATDSNETAVLQGKKIYLKDLRERLNEKPVDIAGSIKIPVLIIQNMQEDERDASVKFAPMIDGILTDKSNQRHALKYYGYLGPYFGTYTGKSTYAAYYETDRDVLADIKEWLDATLS